MRYRLRKRRIALALLTILGLYRCNDVRNEATVPPATISVGAWNLEWLGSPGKRGRLGARSAADLKSIAALIQDELRLSIVILEEINIESQEWRTLREALTRRGYELTWGGEGGAQRIAIAYAARDVEPLGPAFEGEIQTRVLASPRCTTRIKPPLFQSFRVGGFDFTVAGVHLKSNLAYGCDEPRFAEEVRGYQVDQLLNDVRRLEPTGGVDSDLIVAGDFNEGLQSGSRPHHGAAVRRLKEAGFLFLTDPSYRAQNSGVVSFRKGELWGAPDHIAITAGSIREYIPASTWYLPRFTTMSDAEVESFRRSYSDHCPVWSKFRIDLPDDD